MDKTKVDDMLISMITPKVLEIEKKFGNNEPLTQEDINTLLLKSQYNHINHLDLKLNEVTADVSSLKTDFKFLEQNVTNKIEKLEDKFTILEDKFTALENKMDSKFESFEYKIEATIQKALNKNMMMLVVVLGAFFTLSKAMDIFLK